MRAKYTAEWGVQIVGIIFKHALTPRIKPVFQLLVLIKFTFYANSLKIQAFHFYFMPPG
ncbi:DUF6783 domain-containing protein [Ruminococcus sp. 1001136sp1]|uniref:DUF6783 domain-containing protein n=1 Tax=Ruminococcus sp. 1001136sp1 TaxID=2986996 RepID=UPI003FA6F300